MFLPKPKEGLEAAVMRSMIMQGVAWYSLCATCYKLGQVFVKRVGVLKNVKIYCLVDKTKLKPWSGPKVVTNTSQPLHTQPLKQLTY